jgi:hypothetical protein
VQASDLIRSSPSATASPCGLNRAVSTRRSAVRAVSAQVVTDVHVNPHAGHREVWIRDPGGYLERGLGD